MNLNKPHRRRNPLTGQWVLVSPHRAKRPWMGQNEKVSEPDLPEYDPNCYLCPTNTRNSGITNPDYHHTYSFDNDFPSLLPPTESDLLLSTNTTHPLFRAEEETGICKVVCFSPKHNLTLPEMHADDIVHVVNTWADETETLGALDFIQYVQVFENKGEVMGCSQPHPHSQIWATRHVPNEPAQETIEQARYLANNGACLLCDYLKQEKKDKIRIIAENDDFTGFVPFWAVWPFEILVAANAHVTDMPSLSASQRYGLADILRQVTIKYDNLFDVSFPYSMGFHGAPTDGQNHPEWHFHAHFYPPLLRSATVKKFMVGFEMLGMPQRDITAEAAAERIRNLPTIHYKHR